MNGLDKKVNSNRRLAKRFHTLNRINFCSFKLRHITKISSLRKVPFDLHTLEVTDSNYIYRACINETEEPFKSINRIKYNPNPQYISRANVFGQGIAYYACAPDISIIEGCQDSLRNSDKRKFTMTLSKWKIRKRLSVQIVCNSKKSQQGGTDLHLFCNGTKRKRLRNMKRKDYRTYFLKTRLLADQYAKTNIKCDEDYYISALHSKSVLNPHKNIDGIIYPSVGYLYTGFNYAFPPRLFDNNYFELEEVSNIYVEFDKTNYKKYPYWGILETTSNFENDRILW
ncbi:hypothetical protein [Carboxylicivirga sp. RSCT41]|uniref:hypothetical protein n=1 Tax=Carboxylicivirga agarovorans TaxID=3417570 RepID=UPI003D3355EB